MEQFNYESWKQLNNNDLLLLAMAQSLNEAIKEVNWLTGKLKLLAGAWFISVIFLIII